MKKFLIFLFICLNLLIIFSFTAPAKADVCQTLTDAQKKEDEDCLAADQAALCWRSCDADATLTTCPQTSTQCTDAQTDSIDTNEICISSQRAKTAAESAASGTDCAAAVAAAAALAANPASNAGTPTTAQNLPNPLVNADADPVTALQVVGYALRAMLGMLGAVTLLMFVYGGFMLVWAHGNEEMIKKGQSTLLWAVIGMGFVLSSYALLKYLFQLIQGT